MRPESDAVSLPPSCSHEVGGHAAEAHHDFPELRAGAVQTHEVSAEARGPGFCWGGRVFSQGVLGRPWVTTLHPPHRGKRGTEVASFSLLSHGFPTSSLFIGPKTYSWCFSPGGNECLYFKQVTWNVNTEECLSERGDVRTPFPQRAGRSYFRLCRCTVSPQYSEGVPSPRAARRSPWRWGRPSSNKSSFMQQNGLDVVQ